MARLSTGQAFGPTGRQTSQRLLGAAEQMATPGILAQSSINQPALQPQAAPVDLFQQTGGPTLGGPVRMFEPSPLPGPSQDMAALARALGNFSPILQTFGEQYVQRLKTEDERAKLIGQQFSADLRAKYPGQQLVDLRDQLYRQTQAGDVTAAEAYNKVQALSPLQLAYANRYNELALTRDSVNTAAGRFSQLADIEGTPRDQIPPGDPRLKAAQTSLIRPTSDPVVFAELAPEMEKKYAEMDRDHATVHRAFKTRQASTATKNNLNSIFTAQRIDRAGAAGELTATLNDVRINLGIEDYQKYVKDIIPWMAEAVLAGSVVDGKIDLGTWIEKSNDARQILGQIRVGPDGQTLLVEQLGAEGGVTAALQLQDELVKRYKGISDNVDYIAKESGEEQGRAIAAQNRVGDPTLTPTEALAAETAALQQAMKIQDPVLRQATIEQIQQESKAPRLVAANQQKLVESTIMFSYDKDPNVEIPKIENLIRSGLISPEAGRRELANYRQIQAADLKPFISAAKQSKKLLMDQETAAMSRPGSEGGSTITVAEQQRLAQRSAEIDADIEIMRRSGMANNMPVSQLRQELDAYVADQNKRTQAAPAAGITTPPAYESPEKWSDSLGLFGRMGPGNRAANYQLEQQVKNRALFPKSIYDQNFKRFLTTGELTEPLRLMIKRSGYQNKPAQFFMDQWRHVHGDGVPIPRELEGRLQELNNLKISFAPQPQSVASSTYASISNAMNTVMRTALDVVAPPAMAAPAVGQVRISGTGFGGLLGLIRSGEGGWNSVNRGRAGDSPPMPNLTAQPIGVIEDMQARNRVFAVGAYQFTPGVLARARREAGLSPNDPFTPENQNRMAMALITGSKRKRLADYIRGRSDNLNAAHEDIAFEWASLQGPSGRGMYDRDKAGNMAGVPAATVRAALQEARRAYLSGQGR
jgi:hypothetical protein